MTRRQALLSLVALPVIAKAAPAPVTQRVMVPMLFYVPNASGMLVNDGSGTLSWKEPSSEVST